MAWEFSVDARIPQHKMVDISCSTCGDQSILIPQAVLVWLVGSFIPCPICLQDSVTCVARVIEVND